MRIDGKYYKGIELLEDRKTIQIIDQALLPHNFVLRDLTSSDDVVSAISDMMVRGAPLFGVAAGFGMYLAAIEAQHEKDFDKHIIQKANMFKSSRPTAVDLFKAVDLQLEPIIKADALERVSVAYNTALAINDSTIRNCRLIGEYGLPLIENISRNKSPQGKGSGKSRKDSRETGIVNHVGAG